MATNEELTAELQRKTQQLEQLTAAVQQIQTRQATDQHREKILREIRCMSTFTGQGEVCINSFICNVEYYLSSVMDENLKKCMVRAIYYEKIQGEATNVIINLPHPDDWQSIKVSLKLRYGPDMEPTEIYRKISSLKVNTVSELVVEIQNLKFKSDELIAYYTENNFIDLSNVDSILLNTIIEMTQGIVLDKIYEERDLMKVIGILRKRKFEDSDIRPEFRKHVNKFRSDTNNHVNRPSNNIQASSYKNNNRQLNNTNYRQNYNPNYNNNRPFNNNRYNNNSGQFRHNQQSGNFRGNSGQYCQEQNYHKQRRVEPMKIDNIEMKPEICETNNVEFFIN